MLSSTFDESNRPNSITEHTPPGYRLLFQAIGAQTEDEAKARAVSIFGRIYDLTDIISVRGVYRSCPLGRYDWSYRPDEGYMLFIKRP